MLAIAGTVVTGLFGLVSSWLSNRKEKAKARHERDVAIIKGKQKLAEGEQSHNSAWELEALKSASQFLRWCVAFTILAPIWLTMYDAQLGGGVFTKLRETVPDQWWWLFLILCGFVFASKNLVELIKGGSNFWKK